MTFKVELTRRAIRDLREQYAWWSQHGRVEAEKWQSRFLRTVVEKLESSASVYPVADEAEASGVDLRMMSYGKGRQVYRVLFTIVADTVYIQRIRHAAQDALGPDDL